LDALSFWAEGCESVGFCCWSNCNHECHASSVSEIEIGERQITQLDDVHTHTLYPFPNVYRLVVLRLDAQALKPRARSFAASSKPREQLKLCTGEVTPLLEGPLCASSLLLTTDTASSESSTLKRSSRERETQGFIRVLGSFRTVYMCTYRLFRRLEVTVLQ